MEIFNINLKLIENIKFKRTNHNDLLSLKKAINFYKFEDLYNTKIGQSCKKMISLFKSLKTRFNL